MNSNFDGLIEEEDPDSGLVEDAFDVLPDEQTLPFDEIDFDFDFSEDNFGRCSTGEEFSDLLELDGLDTSLEELEDNVFPFEKNHKNIKNVKCIDDNDYTDINIADVNAPLKKIELEESVKSLSVNDNNICDCRNLSNFETEPDNVINSNSNKEGSKTNTSTNESHGGKLVSFSKEQARQWRRKRILNSCNRNEQKLPVIGLKKEEQHKSSQKCPLKLEPLLPLPKDLKPIVPNKLKTSSGKTNPREKLENPLLGGERLGTKTKRGKSFTFLFEVFFLTIYNLKSKSWVYI